MDSKIAVFGKGNVGGALTRGLGRAGHELRTIGNAAEDVRSASAWADVVVFAVPCPAIDAVVAELGGTVREWRQAMTPPQRRPSSTSRGRSASMPWMPVNS